MIFIIPKTIKLQDMEGDFLSALINQLELNQNFPKYQLERRVDIFFNLFLPDIIKWKFGSDYKIDFIIPELPIKNIEDKRSKNVDYFVICNTNNKGFLVELKTDKNSCSPDQLALYFRVQSLGLQHIIGDIDEILKGTRPHYRKKYIALYNLLNTYNHDIEIEIIYILPSSGQSALLKLADELKRPVHFITLEELSNIEVTSFQEEWAIFWKSKLFKFEK